MLLPLLPLIPVLEVPLRRAAAFPAGGDGEEDLLLLVYLLPLGALLGAVLDPPLRLLREDAALRTEEPE